MTLQWAIPQLLETSKSQAYNPAFLLTCGLLYRDPSPILFSLGVGKAAQHNLLHNFHKKYEPKIHVAVVPVGGFVSDDAKVTSARNVAEEFWKLYGQQKGSQGKFSVEMEDPDYLPMLEGLIKQVEGN